MSQKNTVLFDVRFGAYPDKFGGALRCAAGSPPTVGEGAQWVDPATSIITLWRIQKVEHYVCFGCPSDGIPASSKAFGAVWFEKIADLGTELYSYSTKPRPVRS